MKLQQIETWATVPPTGIGGTFWVIVRLTTDNGIQGIGECYGIPVSGDIACQMVEDTFERYIAGESPFNMETLFRRVYSAGFTQRPDVSMMGVFSGMEIAVWDILGKALNQPVYNLIGGQFHDRLRTYTYLYPKHLKMRVTSKTRPMMFITTVMLRRNVHSTISRWALPRSNKTPLGHTVFKAAENSHCTNSPGLNTA